MNFKLGRLSVTNFKAIADEIFDLRNFHTAILDGPNGFGKTSIFDALEICLTGKIGRISSSRAVNNTKSHSCHFLKRDSTLISTILLELIADRPEDSFVVKTEIAADISGAAASMKRYHEHICRFTGSAWDTSEWSKLDNLDLWNRLDLPGGANLFGIQHYISQEDTISFLRDNDEAQRHVTLSHLFGTAEQTHELNVFLRAKDLLVKKTQILTEQISAAKDDLSKLSSEVAQTDENAPPQSSGAIEYVESFKDVTGASLANVSAALESLKSIQIVAISPDAYNALRFNELAEVLTTSRDQELTDLIAHGSIKNTSDLSKIDKAHRKLSGLRKRLDLNKQTVTLLDRDNGSLTNPALEHLRSHYYLTSRSFGDLTAEFLLIRDQNSGVSRILQQIQDYRNSLLESYKAFHLASTDHDVSCPLCGDFKEGQIAQLCEESERQEALFKALSSDSLKRENDIRTRLLENFVLPLSMRLRRRVVKSSWTENLAIRDFLMHKSSSEVRFNKMVKVRNWLDEHGISYQDLVDPDLIIPTDSYSEKRDALKSKIRNRKREVSSDIIIETDEIRRSCSVLGIENDRALLSIPAKSVETDIKFVENILRNLKSTQSQSLQNKLKELSKSLAALKKKQDAVDSVSKIYLDNTKKYEIQVASSIAIPFYVYTSKVLQTRLDGGGIFLKTPATGSREKNPYIRFCSRKDDTHDAWCTMSSGQLAGLVISFALAMNRLYPSKLKSILIDDPVQSMDEINTASLIQLLLHEFPEHQFFVSTHERNVSSYMSYKFTHHGHSVLHINMKERSQKSK